MIEASGLTKHYGAFTAVNNVSFRIGQGEIVGFLGPNGAGKSTTLRMLAGFIGPTSGKILLNGFDVVDEPLRARASVGYMPEASPLYPEMRVIEYLRFRAQLKIPIRKNRVSAIEQAMRDTQIIDVSNVLIGHLSKGYKQRVGLADALLGKPPILILDEPTAGLDPNQIRDVRELIVALGKDHTVLLSTHILSEVEATCMRAIVIAKGRLIAEGSMEDLTRRRVAGVDIILKQIPDAALEQLRSNPGVKHCSVFMNEKDCTRVRVEFVDPLTADNHTETILTDLVSNGIRVRHVIPISTSLEEVFSLLTSNSPKETSSAEVFA